MADDSTPPAGDAANEPANGSAPADGDPPCEDTSDSASADGDRDRVSDYLASEIDALDSMRKDPRGE